MESMVIAAAFIAIAVLVVLFVVYRRRLGKARHAFIEHYQFPAAVMEKLGEQYPELTDEEKQQVIRGLRDYFHICSRAGNLPVAMPSKVVDFAWHEFILFTREYETFCKQGLGRFLHHNPAGGEGKVEHQQSLKTAWQLSSKQDNAAISASTYAMPLLFAIDTNLNIKDGFDYSDDKNLQSTSPNCSAAFLAPSDASGDSSSSTDGGSSGCSGSGCSGG